MLVLTLNKKEERWLFTQLTSLEACGEETARKIMNKM